MNLGKGKNEKVRLNKYLSRCGTASRRKADEWIGEGRVKVNHQIIRKLGVRIDPESDRVEVDNREVRPETKKYIMINKPPGCLVSRADSLNRPTVMDLIPGEMRTLFPVGRLDMNSEGLLLLTNDGELAHRLMHPRYEIPKEYIAEVHGCPGDRELGRIRRGVMVDGRCAVPDEVRLLRKKPDSALFKIRLHEGRKREIRRMFDAVGHPVKTLRRVAFAGLTLGKLRPGDWRRLTPGEIGKLRTAVPDRSSSGIKRGG
ncbi:MAG: pseudouridine synthase [Candidatus Aminicenantes bacterium]